MISGAALAALAARQNVPLPWAVAVFVLTLPIVKLLTWLVTFMVGVRRALNELRNEVERLTPKVQEISILLTESELRVQWGEGQEHVAPWSTVTGVRLFEGDVLITFTEGFMRIPASAFADAWQRRTFVARGEELCASRHEVSGSGD
ncbi:MAG: hypothetical protein WBV82_08520 [Myxococcaceae bacterium]